MGSFNSTCALTRNPIQSQEPVILFPIYCRINKNNNFPILSDGWKFCLNESNEPMPLYGHYNDCGLFTLSPASLGLSDMDKSQTNVDLASLSVSLNQSNNFKGGKYTKDFLDFLKSNLLPTERGNNQYNDNEIRPVIFIQEVEQFFKSSNEQSNTFNKSQGNFKVHGSEIFRFEYLLIDHPENPSKDEKEIANLRFCAMSYNVIAKVLNLPEHNPDECNCEYDYNQIQLVLESVDNSYAGLSGFDKCVQYFLNHIHVLKPTLPFSEPALDFQTLLSKLNTLDTSNLFQNKTKESKFCSLTLLPINQGDTFYMIPIQYKLTQYGNNPYVYSSHLNFYDPFMRLFYDDKFNLDALLTKMIKCQLVENGLVKISNDNIINTNPMLKIITYHEYPYFMPSGSNDIYQIRCGISQGVVYDCLLISESAIKLLMNEFETVSKLDLVNDNKTVNYELISQYPILGYIQSSKVTLNTIYQKLHKQLSILDWFDNVKSCEDEVGVRSGEYEATQGKANQQKVSNVNEYEINIKYILDCFKQKNNMNIVDKFFKIGILLHALFTISDSMMFTYLDMRSTTQSEATKYSL